MSAKLVELLSGLPPELIVIIVAAVPIIELRGAIPIGILLLRLPPWETFMLAMIGNTLPVPVLLLLLGPMRRWATGWPVVGPVLRWAEERANRRRGQVERYGFPGLIAFVGVPLPGTGAWTGSLIAVILGLSFWRSLAAICMGVVAAGLAIALLSAAGLMALGQP